ncbi:MAG: TetR/AcrR family transcriptional regulator [Parvularculaceae bacterium]
MTKDTNPVRASIIEAFNGLILSKRKLRPPVAEVLDKAGVARSTFYEHFNSRDSLLITAIRGPLGVVADAVTGNGDSEKLSAVLSHFMENRRGAIEALDGALSMRITRALAELIADRSPGRSANSALHLAEIEIGFIRLWLKGDTPYAPRDLASLMIRSADAMHLVMNATAVE